MKTILTVVIKKDNELLMVQEAQEKCYKKWNFPAGHLDEGESVFDGAVREAKEETGYDVKLISLLSVQNYKRNDDIIRIIFNAEIVSGDIAYDTEEILDVKWIPIETIENMGEDLRGADSLLDIVNDVKANKQYPLEIIKNIL